MPKDWAGVDLHLDLDTSGGRRAGLERALRAAIRTGRLAPGAPVPSTRALAGHLGLSRGTVTAAYDQLTAEGYLTTVPGSGTRVAEAATRGSPRPPAAGPDEPRAPAHDLLPGRPDLSTFPSSAWLREALAGYLGRARGVHADPARIVITSGYAQSLGLLATVLAGAGPAAMEEPGHPFHRAIVRRAGLDIVPLAVDDLGARPGGLGRAGIAVLTPAHQYPAGATLAPDRRRAAPPRGGARGGRAAVRSPRARPGGASGCPSGRRPAGAG